MAMMQGVHALIYAKDAEKTRAFFRDVLELPSVEAGRGWLIFALPPSELAVHPTDGEERAELYLMCRDVKATIAALEAKGVAATAVTEEPWGFVTTLTIPGGLRIGIYQPKHPTAIAMKG